MGTSIPAEADTRLLTELAETGVEPAKQTAPEPSASAPLRIADRYLVQGELGRGGLAIVYRVLDSTNGRALALKQLALSPSHRLFSVQAAAFEREFHTLVQLSHPRIIEVYDFGIDERGRYYTMELLEGGDLKQRSPLAWREACALAYDVCSSLALLHSRRLVHRDISPRNVRCTLSGSAKLIDFGALVPMGPCAQVVGTPRFVAPEALHRSAIDGRADLFSLGATLYFVLTGRSAYSANQFSELHEAWGVRPAAPSLMVPDVPPALDALVLSLISLEPAARPHSAFEVMQRLATIAGLAHTEDAGVSQAYLSAPVLVGRDEPLTRVRGRLERAADGKGSSVLIRGAAGVGRSRLLDDCALEAKLSGILMLRVNADSTSGEPLAVGRSLVEQIAETISELVAATSLREADAQAVLDWIPDASGGSHPVTKPFPSNAADRSAYQAALTRWLLRVARTHAMAILVDDLHKVDAASLSLLATLALSAPRLRLLLLATLEQGRAVAASDALAVLERECTTIELSALDREQIEALARSLFGDVPNLALVCERLYDAARGNPRETIDLVQSLIARGRIRYEGGRWLLPGQLRASELATSAAESCQEAVLGLSVLARALGQTHALATHPALSRNQYALAMPEVPSAQLDEAISELLAARALVGDARMYALSRREWADALLAQLDHDSRRDRHLRLAALYAHDERTAVERTDHLLLAGEDEAAVSLLVQLLFASSGDSQGLLSVTTMSADQLASILDRGLSSAERLAKKPRELNEIRRAVCAIAIVSDEATYLRAAPAWFAQLAQDSGLSHYRALSEIADPGARLMRALTLTLEQFGAMPEEQRVYNPEAAIKNLAYYVVMSIALGSRMQDAALIGSLPAVIEPFAALSPLLNAIWQNSIATLETLCDNQPELGRRRWLEVLDALSKVSSADLSYVAPLRRAIVYGIGLTEARLGMACAEQTVRALDEDPMQASSAMSLRKIARLHQGDFAGAERFRKRAEQIALHANVRSMFSSTLLAELVAYGLASDLTGLRQVADTLEPLAARFPGWLGYKHLADGYFEQTRGQLEAALEAFERGLLISHPAPRVTGLCCGAWPRLIGASMETLIGLDRAEEAKLRGERALRECKEHRIDAAAFVIRRALALAEVKLGDYEGASRRLQAVIAELSLLGVTGLELGATYEARTRIAIWSSDQAAVVEYGRLTARAYRYGEGSSLGARYERLMDEARKDGQSPLPELIDLQSRWMTSRMQGTAASFVDKKLAGATSPAQQTERLLQVLIELRGGHSGHLYIRNDAGLEHVAALGGAAPDPALDELMARYLSRHVETSAFTTRVGGSDGSQHSQSSWLDATGAPYHPIVLMAELDGARVPVGAALIAAETSSAFATASQDVLDAVGRALLQLRTRRG